ncbi:hypothetical protein BDV98DRAFT_506588, partial [Pterulicium gracile]
QIGTIQRRLAWPLHKDDTLARSCRPTGLNVYFVSTTDTALFHPASFTRAYPAWGLHSKPNQSQMTSSVDARIVCGVPLMCCRNALGPRSQ